MPIVMPFGRHAGKPLRSVPTAYLAWLLRACRDIEEPLRDAVRRELAWRRSQDAGGACRRRERYAQDTEQVRGLPPVPVEDLERQLLATLEAGEQAGAFGDGPHLRRLWAMLAVVFHQPREAEAPPRRFDVEALSGRTAN